MKCPYRKIIIHIPATTYTHSKDVEEFADCHEEECPYYRSDKQCQKEVNERKKGRVYD